VDTALANKDVLTVNANGAAAHEWKYFASSEGSYIEQEIYTTSPSSRSRRARRRDPLAHLQRRPAHRRLGDRRGVRDARERERIAAEAVEYCTAKPIDMGMKDLILTPSHAMLTIHEIVGHATELDRIVGYEANYAGTSFVKVSDLGKLKYGSKLFNVTADRNIPGGVATSATTTTA
jgi:TldD protein